MFSIFEHLAGRARRAITAYRRHKALRILRMLDRPGSPQSPQAWLANLPPQFGIRQAVNDALEPHLALLQAHNIPLRSLICGIINHGLRQPAPLPRVSDWQALFAALAAPGPVLLMCSGPALQLLSPWFKRVSPHGFRDMVRDLNDPECKSKYVCSTNLGATGWSCHNQNVRIVLFNVRNPAVVTQAQARVRRINS